MKWNIICDSSCDTLEIKHLAEDTNFSIAPMKIIFGSKEFIDDENWNREEMLNTMTTYTGASSTACPAPFDWAKEFEKRDYSIAITISGSLSGSYNSAVTAKDMVLEQYPEKKIHIVDSRSTSGTLILLAICANTLIKQGASFEQVVNELERYNNSLQLTFCLKSYDNLVRTGRMNKIVGLAATALGLRAVAMKTSEGKISVMSKQRGDLNAYKYMVNQMASLKDLKDRFIIISHVNNEEGAKKIKALLVENYGATRVAIIPTRGLCSYYADNGGILVAY